MRGYWRGAGLEEVQRTWDRLAVEDPLWAIHSVPDKKGNRWEWSEFMATGISEIEQLTRYLADRGLRYGRRHALDFGCGVGRLSQALADHFDRVTGLDISPSMLELARARNRSGERCTYVLNQSGSLSVFQDGEFDLIYSNVTLQHVPRRLALGYIAEFVRILAPGGILVFQLPSHPASWRTWLRTALPRPLLGLYRRLCHGAAGSIQMNAIRCTEVLAAIERAGGRVLHVVRDGSAESGWASFRYIVSG